MCENRVTIQNCPHHNITPETCVCNCCGIIVGHNFRLSGAHNGDFEDTKHVSKKSQTHTPLFEAGFKGVPQDMIDLSEKISTEMTETNNNRSKKRKMRQFACLYYAHKERGINVTPSKLATMCGIQSKDMSPALMEFSQVKTGYKSKMGQSQNQIDATISIALDDADVLGLTPDAKRELSELIFDCVGKSADLSRRNPRTVACGAIRFYSEINGLVYDKDTWENLTTVSSSTATQAVSEFSEAYNG